MSHTAGQERFSSLFSAFFRGSKTVILIFDVKRPKMLRPLNYWWSELYLCYGVQTSQR